MPSDILVHDWLISYTVLYTVRHFFYPTSPLSTTSIWRRGSESNRRMRLLQSPALPLGYPATQIFNTKFDSRPGQVQSAKPNLRRCVQSSFGLKIPTGVMMPVINSGGVTSNPGFRAPLVGLATRMYSRWLRLLIPQAPKTSCSCLSSIGMSKPRFNFQSIVESGIATQNGMPCRLASTALV